MDNLGSNSPRSGSGLDKPIPLGNGPGASAPAKEGPAGGTAAVSRAPLNLGGTGAGPAVAAPAAPTATPGPAAPAAAPSAMPRVQPPQAPITRPLAAGPAPSGRITSCKTFFTKLHPGAIEFLDEQISNWLKANPSIVIKHTNVTTGEVQAKKTEENILITVWY